MRPPRLESVWFDGPSQQYPRLAKVLEYTARKHNPGWLVNVVKVDPCNLSGDSFAYTSNSHKLEYWANTIRDAEDGERVLLIDADVFVLGPLDGIWDGDFDLKLTRRDPSSPFPINGGVVAVNVNQASRDFMAAWFREDRMLLANPEEHKKLHKLYAGMNQCSLGALRSRGTDCRILEVPCQEWNCEDSTWSKFDPGVTKVVHVKSGLRSTVFAVGPAVPKVRELALMWRRLEREAICPVRPGS